MVAAWGSDSDDDEVDETALMDLGDSNLEEEDDASEGYPTTECPVAVKTKSRSISLAKKSDSMLAQANKKVKSGQRNKSHNPLPRWVRVKGGKQNLYMDKACSRIGLGTFLFVLLSTYGLAIWYGSKMVIEKGYHGGDVISVLMAIMICGIFGWGKLKREVNCYQFKYLVDYHFVVPSVKIVSLVGESGRENSIVISLLERFYDPEAGGVRIDGVNLKKYQLKWLRQQIGLVSQEPILFAITIKENISYGKQNATEEEINTAIEIANAANFIKLRDSSLNLDCTSFFGVALGAIIPVKRGVSA
ncbi:hypothetical protein BC332_20730 [Capsicum chinense]|nr:hypothetical protein BC332_20730 [Capsicum chinense]